MKFKIVNSKFKVDSDLEIKDLPELTDESSTHLLHLFDKYVKSRFRYSSASTKTRSEVKCSTAKMYKQKGTGNARRGAASTPLRRGGGVIFGPKPRSFDFKLNKKVIKNAHKQVLSRIASKTYILDEKFEVKKTKEVSKFLLDLNLSKKVVLLITELDLNAVLPFRNLKNIYIDFVDNYEPELLLTSDAVLFTKSSFDSLRGYANV
jgi:large subunit ribosomal protein L4